MKKMLYLCYLIGLNPCVALCMKSNIPYAIKNYQKIKDKPLNALNNTSKNKAKRGPKGKKKPSPDTKPAVRKIEKKESEIELSIFNQNEMLEVEELPKIAKNHIDESEYEKGTELLFEAVRRSNISLIQKYLLLENVKIDRPDNRGRTALLCAIFERNVDVVQFLIDSGADCRPIHNNPLEVANLMGNKRIIQLLESKQLADQLLAVNLPPNSLPVVNAHRRNIVDVFDELMKKKSPK